MIAQVGSARPVVNTHLGGLAANGPSGKTEVGQVGSNPELQHLTKSDFELIYQATGQRIDPSSDLVPMFAIQLANDRQYGGLPSQGPVPADYLAGLASRYSDAPWMVEQATRALGWVEDRGGYSSIDLNV